MYKLPNDSQVSCDLRNRSNSIETKNDYAHSLSNEAMWILEYDRISITWELRIEEDGIFIYFYKRRGTSEEWRIMLKSVMSSSS